MEVEFNDYHAYGENIGSKVPQTELIKALYNNTYDKLGWISKGINEGFGEEWFENIARDPIDDEISVLYEDLYGDDSNFEVINVEVTKQSPSNYLSTPTGKIEHENRELLRKVFDDLIKKDLEHGNT